MNCLQFFMYNICSFIKIWKVTEQLLCTQQQQLLLLPAGYITAQFHSSTSIGGWVIDVCAKIQDGGCRHLGLQFCNAGPPTKSICAPEIALQISCWSSAYFSRFCYSKISHIWFKMPIQASIIIFWGVLTPKHYFLSSRSPKGRTLRGNTHFEP